MIIKQTIVVMFLLVRWSELTVTSHKVFHGSITIIFYLKKWKNSGQEKRRHLPACLPVLLGDKPFSQLYFRLINFCQVVKLTVRDIEMQLKINKLKIYDY